MRKTLATVLISLAVPLPSAFAQEANRPGVVINTTVVVSPPVDFASTEASVQAYLRPSPFRDAIAREAARLGQSSAPASSPQPVAGRSWMAESTKSTPAEGRRNLQPPGTLCEIQAQT